MATPIAPGEAHPAYARKAGWIRDWLGQERSQHTIYMPYRSAVRLDAFDDPPSPTASPDFKKHVLTKKKAAGPAPWAGCPFFYVWYVAEDELGRMVAGDSRITWACSFFSCDSPETHGH